jgi:hypothetical protein
VSNDKNAQELLTIREEEVTRVMRELKVIFKNILINKYNFLVIRKCNSKVKN